MVSITLHHVLLFSCFACINGMRFEAPVQEHSVARKQSRPKTILVAQLDYEFIEWGFLDNWFAHAQKFLDGGSMELLFDTDDAKVLKYLKSFNFGNIKYKTVRDMSVKLFRAGPHGTESYKNLMGRRPQVIQELLRAGNVVFQFDLDTVWAKDPFVKFLEADGHDVLVTSDYLGERRGQTMVCGCLLYFRPSERTINMMTDWLQSINEKDAGNQKALNRVLLRNKKEKKVDVAFLKFGDFPPGKWAKDYPNATIFHANWMAGLARKQRWMKKKGIWIVDVAFLKFGDFPPGKWAKDYPNATIFHANWMAGLARKQRWMKKNGIWIVDVDGPAIKL